MSTAVGADAVSGDVGGAGGAGERTLICGVCGYELQGISSDRCPECGERFDAKHLISDLAPWEGRRFIGWLRAFFATVWEGTVRVDRLARRADWPVNARAARWFRRWVLTLAMASAVGVGAWWRAEQYFGSASTKLPNFSSERLAWVFVLNPWSFGVTLLGLGIWIGLAGTLVSMFFYSPKLSEARQKRAVALSAYACAPLAWLPVAFGVGALIVGITVSRSPLQTCGQALQALSWIGIVVQAVGWMRARRRRRVTGSEMRTRLLAVGLTLAVMGVADLMAIVDWTGNGHLYGFGRNETINEAIPPLLAFGAVMAVFWWNTLRLLRLTMAANWRRVIGSGVLIPLLWLGLLVGILITLHAVFFIAQALIVAV